LDRSSGQLLADGQCLEHGTVAVPPAPDVVDLSDPGIAVKRVERAYQVAAIEIVAYLFAFVAVDLVPRAGGRASCEIGKKPVELRSRMIRAGKTAGAKDGGTYIEVAAILLDHHVGGKLGYAKNRMLAE